MKKWFLCLTILALGCGNDLQRDPQTGPHLSAASIAPAYQEANLLAARSAVIYDNLKAVVVPQIVALVEQSRKHPLTPDEKVRLSHLNDLRKLSDTWAAFHNAYLDILGAIDYLTEKSDQDDRDRARIAQLLAGLPKNNQNMSTMLAKVRLACDELHLDVGNF